MILGHHRGENLVPAVAGFLNIVSAQTLAHAALCVVGQVQGVVQPPGPVVVPEMVVRVLIV